MTEGGRRRGLPRPTHHGAGDGGARRNLPTAVTPHGERRDGAQRRGDRAATAKLWQHAEPRQRAAAAGITAAAHVKPQLHALSSAQRLLPRPWTPEMLSSRSRNRGLPVQGLFVHDQVLPPCVGR